MQGRLVQLKYSYCKESENNSQVQPVMKQVAEFSLLLKQPAQKMQFQKRRAACNAEQVVDIHEGPSILAKKAVN